MLLLLHFIGIALVFLFAWFAGHYLDRGLSLLFQSQLIHSRLPLESAKVYTLSPERSVTDVSGPDTV